MRAAWDRSARYTGVNVLAAGDRIERYRVDAVLSARDGAVVYAATEDETSRAVAIIVLDGEPSDASALRTRTERAEHAAGLARMQAVEPIATGRLPDGRAFVVNERSASLPIVARSPAPIGAVFGSASPGAAPMDAGRAMLTFTSQRAKSRAVGRLARLAVRALVIGLVALGVALAWFLATR